LKIYHRKSWARQTKKLNARRGERVWTRQLVSLRIVGETKVVRVFLSSEDQPAFRCEFIREQGDKHLLVRGPDGAEYSVHKCYAGKNPACTVSFDGKYHPACDRALKCIRNHPGTSIPDESTEILDMRREYPAEFAAETLGR